VLRSKRYRKWLVNIQKKGRKLTTKHVRKTKSSVNKSVKKSSRSKKQSTQAAKATALRRGNKAKMAKLRKQNTKKSRVTKSQVRILRNYLLKYLTSANKTRAALATSQINRGQRLTFWWHYYTKVLKSRRYRKWLVTIQTKGRKLTTKKTVKKAKSSSVKKSSGSKKQSSQASGQMFQIKSKMNGGKVLNVAEYMGESHYRLRIRSPRGDKREWFVYDKKSNSIRFAHDPRFVLGTQNNHFVQGAAVVLRPFTSKHATETKSKFTNGHLVNMKSGWCLDSVGGKNTNHNPVTFWKCDKSHSHQNWSAQYQKGGSRVQLPATPISK